MPKHLLNASQTDYKFYILLHFSLFYFKAVSKTITLSQQKLIYGLLHAKSGL